MAASPRRARSAIRPWSRWCRSASSGSASCRRFRTSPAAREELLQLLFRNFVPGISDAGRLVVPVFRRLGGAGDRDRHRRHGRDRRAAAGHRRGPAQRVVACDGAAAVGAARPCLLDADHDGADAGRHEPDLVHLSRHTRPAAPASTRRRSPSSPAAGRICFARSVPFLLEWLACALLYCLIPNCAVRWRDAMLGAAVAAVSIEMLKIGFVDLYRLAVVVSDRLRRDRRRSRSFCCGCTCRGRPCCSAPLSPRICRPGGWTSGCASYEQRRRAARLQPGADRRAGSRRSAAAKTCRIGRSGRRTRRPDLGYRRAFADAGAGRLHRATQGGRWVLAWDPQTATLHDLYLALGLPLAGTWLARPLVRRGRCRSRRRWSGSSGPRRRRCG